MQPKEKLIQLLKSRGYSATKARLSVFDALLQAHEAVTPTQLIESVPDSDMVSVYRTIQLFEKIDVIHRVWNGFKSKLELSELFSPHHHHFTCSRCSASIAIKSEDLEHSLHGLEATYGFALREHSVELSGFCRECRMVAA